MSNADSVKGHRQNNFSPSSFFVFRTPLLPFAEFSNWGDGLAAVSALADPTGFAEAYAKDCAILRERLGLIYARAEVRDALFVAAPNVVERFHLWTDGAETERGGKVEHVLVRYFSRMTGRATPFGLFAGCSVGALGDETRLVIEGRDRYARHTRLDNDYLFALAGALAHEQSFRNIFKYKPNDSLYHAAGRWRYVEARLKDQLRSYHLVAVEATDYLKSTLTRARDGATTEALAAALVDEEISPDEARAYVAELIESQILVPDLALQVTGAEPVHALIAQLREHAETVEVARSLDGARAALELIDAEGLGIEAGRYREAARRLEALPAKVELARLFQVDLMKPAPEAMLGTAVLDEITRGAELMHRLFGRADDALKQFRESFVARYEEREVPLVEALDEELGVGFGASDETSPLLKEILFPPQAEEVRLQNVRRHELLLRKLCAAHAAGAAQMTLTLAEIEGVGAKEARPLPDAFAVTARLSAASQAALDDGEFQLLIEAVFGPSGAILMGRFCHADTALHQHVLAHLRDEESQRPGAIFAEVVHLPEGRLGNVISRPVLRAYEIPYLGRSGTDREHQIPATDLRISVRRGRITLRSARLDREVIPRLTNAHNYVFNSLGIYRFLCTLAQQGVAGGLTWGWGALDSAPFLPRVRVGRLLLTLARWRVLKDELSALGKLRGAKSFEAVQEWRAARKLPRLVALADRDHLLPVDFDNALSVESFVQLIRERQSATLIEMFPAPDHLCASGPEGAFLHELVIPFINKRDEGTEGSGQWAVGSENNLSPPALTSSLSPHPSVLRSFPPGSEWLYAKLYTGTATADATLRDIVRPLVDSCAQSGAVDGWFFLRYGDPDWHLRLRFHGRPDVLQREVLPALNRALAGPLNDGRIWRIQFDTYEQEVERYGGAEGILLAERLFHADSEAALEIVEMLEPGDAGADERWRLALYGIDSLLGDLGFDLQAKCDVMKMVRDGFAQEFRADKNLWAQLRGRFREERRSLEELLRADGASDHTLAPGLEVLTRRSARLAPVIAELKRLEGEGGLTATLRELAPSYIHMHANRILRSAQRQQELVIYDLLTRYYEAQLARAR